MATPPAAPAGSDPEQLAAQAQAEAAEVREDIKETRAEAAEARRDGDPDRAALLEKRVEGMETKLDTVLAQLAKIVDRPFHPAPEPKPEEPAAAEGTPEQPPAEAAPDEKSTPKKRSGRRPSRAFFGARADDDD